MEQTPPTLAPEVFESVVTALADTLIRDYRKRWSHHGLEPSRVPQARTGFVSPTWLKIADAAKRAQCSEATIRREVRAGRLRAVKSAVAGAYDFGRNGW